MRALSARSSRFLGATALLLATACESSGSDPMDGAGLGEDGNIVGRLDAGFVHPDAAQPAPDAGHQVGPDAGPLAGDGLLLRGRAVLPMNGQGPYAPGELHVVGNQIVCVGPIDACAPNALAATVLDTDGIIVPGLVDAHNHVAYNWLPEWEPGQLWDDATRWRDSTLYEEFATPYRDNSGIAEHFCAMVQWGKVRALVNGVTTIFGTPQPRVCYRWLVRNAELTSGYNGWSSDKMRSNTLGIDTVTDADALALIADMDAGEVTAYMIHLAEGISTRAYEEYTELVAKGLLREETVIIHGTALTATDFQQVATAGAKLVWSPSSNMALYGDTTDVGAAVQAGVSVSVAPDWTPSGRDDSLTEIRYARTLADQRWPGTFTSEDYLSMITAVPAAQMAVDTYVGTLEPGKFADVLVVAGDAADPFGAVLAARPSDIRLVLLGGVPSFGEASLVQGHLNTPESCFPISVCGSDRVVCWADTPNGPVTPDSIAEVIRGFYPSGPQPLFDCEN